MGILENKAALITGAGHPQGIGWATAIELARSGADVVVTDIDSNQEHLQTLAEEITRLGRKSVPMSLDVTDSAQAESVVEAAISEFGKLDILVNNAGVGIGSAEFLENTDDVWEATIAVNIRGAVNCCRAALRQMRDQGSGSIVNVASLAGLRQVPSMPAPYTASKFALVGITKSIAEEFGRNGIRCNAVCPGSVATQMRDQAMDLMGATDDASRDAVEAEENAMISLGRAAVPAEIASAIVYLASPAAQYITGVALPVDGGWTVGL